MTFRRHPGIRISRPMDRRRGDYRTRPSNAVFFVLAVLLLAGVGQRPPDRHPSRRPFSPYSRAGRPPSGILDTGLLQRRQATLQQVSLTLASRCVRMDGTGVLPFSFGTLISNTACRIIRRQLARWPAGDVGGTFPCLACRTASFSIVFGSAYASSRVGRSCHD